MRLPINPKLVAVVILPLLLAACFFVPGKFASGITVEKDGRFQFHYKGEIVAFTGGKFMSELDKGGSGGDDEFSPYCYNEDTGATRDCTEKERAEQKKEWDAGAADRAEARAKKDKETGALMSAMLGFNPDDKATVDAFITKLSKYKGWNSIVHKGEGVFEVDYSIAGNLDRDFTFPNLPDGVVPNPMIVVRMRKDNSVHIEAPAMGASEDQMRNGNLLAVLADKDKKDKEEDNPLAAISNGTFTVTTNADILTNNTEDGPAISGKSKVLTWTVNPQTKTRPTALLQLGK